jgi:hypothetical protein
MKNLLRNSGWLVTAVLALGLSAKAQTVLMQNTTTDLHSRFSDGTLEFGNQIDLTSPAYITTFSFEYYGGGAGGAGTPFAGSPEVDVRWYLNNGPAVSGYASPGTLIYNSGAYAIAPTTAATEIFSTTYGDFPAGGWLVSSSELTVTLQFTGLGSGDVAGVELYSPPSVGNMFTDYWQHNTDGTWSLLQNSVNTDIGQEWIGTPVPEPSTLALSLVGGLGLLIAVRRFRNK